MPVFADITATIVRNAGLEPEEKVWYNNEPLAIDADKGTYFHRLTLAPLKGEARCVEKAVNEYGGDYGKLVDVVRGSIVVDTEDQLEAVAGALTRGRTHSLRGIFHVDLVYQIQTCAFTTTHNSNSGRTAWSG